MQKCTQKYDLATTRLKIKTLMLQFGLTQDDIAKQLKMNVCTFNKKLNGQSDWKLEECIALSKCLKSEISYIFLENQLQESI